MQRIRLYKFDNVDNNQLLSLNLVAVQEIREVKRWISHQQIMLTFQVFVKQKKQQCLHIERKIPKRSMLHFLKRWRNSGVLKQG